MDTQNKSTAAGHTPGPVCPVERGEIGIVHAHLADLRHKDHAATTASLVDALQRMTDAYADAMKNAGVSHYPEALFEVRQARAAIARAKGPV